MIAEARVEVRTTRLGTPEVVQVPLAALLTFPDGLPGFVDHRDFALLEDDQLAPFVFLQSLHDDGIGFLALEPDRFVADYAFDLTDLDAAQLGLTDPSQARVLSLLVVGRDLESTTANLQAPIVINQASRRAKQVILTDERWPLRHPVFGPRAPIDDRAAPTCSS